jgi:PAS domain S-box-containing protein
VGSASHARMSPVVLVGSDRHDPLVAALRAEGFTVAGEGSGSRGSTDTEAVLILDLRGDAAACDEAVRTHTAVVRIAVVGAPEDAGPAATRFRARAVVVAPIDAAPERVVALLAAALPAPVGDLREIVRGVGADPDDDGRGGDVRTLAPALRAFLSTLGLRGLTVLARGADDEGRRRLRVLAGEGDAPGGDGRPGQLLGATPLERLGADQAVVIEELPLGDALDALPGPWLLVGVDGQRVAGLAARLPERWEPTEVLDVLRASSRSFDRKLRRTVAESVLVKRVRELDALHRIHLAIQGRPTRPELARIVATALAGAIGAGDGAVVTVTLDGASTVSADPEGTVVLDRVGVVADGRVRGEVTVALPDGGEAEPGGLAAQERAVLVTVADALGAAIAHEESERRLATADERQRRILSSLPSIVWTIDREGEVDVVAVGEAVPVLRRGRVERFHLGDWDDPVARWAEERVRRARLGERIQDELEWRDRRWEVFLEPLRGHDGQVDEVLGLATDVTVIRRAQVVEARLASIIESARVAILSVSLDGVIDTWNAAAERIFGWTAEQAIGRSIRLLEPVDPDALPTRATRELILEAVTNVTELETKRRHRDGHDVDVSLTLSPIVDAAGEVIGASAVYMDLSERRAAERDLRASREQLQLLADHAQDVIYRTRLVPDRRVEYISPSCLTVTGFPPERYLDDVGFSLSRVHPDDVGRVAEALADPATPVVYRARYRHADGDYRWIEDRLSPVIADGEVVALFGVARDVTEEQRSAEATQRALDRERRALDELRHIDSMKSAFLSAVSHELRTPLTSVLGFAETAKRLVGDAGDAYALTPLLERMIANGHRLERLVSDLLDVDRLTQGDVEPRREPTDLRALVDRAAQRYRGNDHVIATDLEPVDAEVDPVMLDRCVDNLIRNATRHTPPGAHVWVGLRSDARSAVVTVEDDGPGVPPELWERVFEPFQQGPASQHSASPGTGIGLSLVQRFVAVHGGSVHLDQRPGGGARFTLVIPLRERAATVAAPTPE